ncbi:unnamed protein product [Moneuplotes crassus]|uniref:Uncharacterized protein n=1 Tax=Euplotes crassus TaxID=5936 RepID=A0AAD1YBX7_EUPCR|nr:unnamed protein product [Moneuplotes crassus]
MSTLVNEFLPKFQKELSQMQLKEEKDQQKMKEMQKELEIMKKSKEDFEFKYLESTRTIEKLTKDGQTQKIKMEECICRLEEKNKALCQKETEFNRLIKEKENDACSDRDKNAKLMSQKRDLDQDLQKIRLENQDYKNKISEYQEKNKIISKENENLKSKISQDNIDYHDALRKLCDYESNSSGTERRDYSQFFNKIEDMKSKIKDLEDSKNKLVKLYERSIINNSELKNNNNELSKKIQESSTKREEETERIICELEEKSISCTIEETTRLRDKTSDLEKKIKNLEIDKQLLKQELENAEVKSKDIQESLNLKISELYEKINETDKIDIILRKTTRQLEQSENNYNILKTKYTEDTKNMEMEITNMTEKQQNMTKSMEENKKTCSEKVNSLKLSLEETKKSLIKLNEENTTLKTDAKELQQKDEKLTKLILNLKIELELKDARLNRMEKDLSDLNKININLKAKVYKYRYPQGHSSKTSCTTLATLQKISSTDSPKKFPFKREDLSCMSNPELGKLGLSEDTDQLMNSNATVRPDGEGILEKQFYTTRRSTDSSSM